MSYHHDTPLRHTHTRDDESLYMFTGVVDVECGEDRFEAGPGSFVYLPRNLPHADAGPCPPRAARGMPARSSPAPADERLEAVKDGAQAEVVGMPGAVGGAVGGAGGGSHPDRQRVGAGVEDPL